MHPGNRRTRRARAAQEIDIAANIPNLTRRSVLGAGAGAVLAGAVGCAGGGTDNNGTDDNGGGPSRTVEHRYGTTEITGTPERVVTVGLTEQDYALALGTTPVGVREWFGEHPGALWPWAEEHRGDDDVPEVLPVEELNLEQIASLGPDLILGVNSGLTQEEYDSLTELAPTVAQAADHADFGAPWQEITRTIGTALDREDEAEELITDIETRFDEVRADYPDFEGATALLTASIAGEAYAYAEGPAPDFLIQLGFVLPEEAEALFDADAAEPEQVSAEELEALEADALLVGVYGAPEDSFTRQDVFQQLETVREARHLEMPEMSHLNGALSFGSVLSLHYALDELPPRLETLMDGDPDTTPDEVE